MDSVRKNEIIAVVLFAISLFLFLSIFTFNEQDLSFYVSYPNPASRNMTGIVGAYISGILLFLMGRASYVIPGLTLIWGVSRLLQMEPRKFFFKLFGTVFLVTAVSASLSMLNYSSRTLAFASGGLIGAAVSGFLIKYLGMIGSAVFISATIVLSVLIATEFLILPLLIGAIKLIAGVPGRLMSSITRKARDSFSRKRPGKSGLKEAKAEIEKKLELIRKQVAESRQTARSNIKTGKTRISEKAGKEPRVVTEKEPRETKAAPARVASVSDGSSGELVDYRLPGLDLLKKPAKGDEGDDEDALQAKAALLENTLSEFGVSAKVVKINRGPVITMYELEPAVGTKVTRITSLGDNISLSMKSANIRIIAPLPGKGTIGIEVPNDKSELVLLGDILGSEVYNEEEAPLKIAMGKDISGDSIVMDLGAMPHLLIAGATGSGKTVCINSLVSSLLFNNSPEELKFLMVDPKRVELMMFAGIPHLISPIVTSPKKVAAALEWIIGEMERRYDLFAGKGVRNIISYKEKAEKDWENLPYIIIIIDELADLMAVSQQEIEGSIMRLAQLSRAAGIHMILATQRPSVNVVTGVIKANFPARISFKVASKVDSRTVLDMNGAEKLLGRGDMLLMEPGRSDVIRGQCSLVEDAEIRNIVKFIKSQASPQYLKSVVEKQERRATGFSKGEDELYEEAVKMVLDIKQASVSMIQRRLKVGYARAARLIDIMEEEGVVGPYNGARPRDILVESIEDLKKEE